jgi:hypothetical protein
MREGIPPLPPLTILRGPARGENGPAAAEGMGPRVPDEGPAGRQCRVDEMSWTAGEPTAMQNRKEGTGHKQMDGRSRGREGDECVWEGGRMKQRCGN